MGGYTVACNRDFDMPAETELAQAWREGWWLGNEWTTTEGQRFRVIYPGYSGLSWGPDFRRAAILQQGKKVKGDIEFHVRSREWVEHGHHRDLAYNGVILHIVWEDDMPGPTLTSSGGRVPVFKVNGLLQNTGLKRSLPCCNPAISGSPELLRNILARQGKQRFLDKAALAYQSFESNGAEEALYRGILQAMGYSENKHPFYELACRLPFQAMRKRVSGLKKEKRRDCIQELYLAYSGLPAERPGLSETYPSNPALYFSHAVIPETCLKRSAWRFYGLRPANQPARRLMAASSLMARYLDEGLIHGVVRSITNLETGERYPHRWLMVEGNKESLNSSRKASLLGRGRALLIVVNVILPFAWALGKKEGNNCLRRRALDLFRRCPSTGDNIVIRHFRRLWGLRLKLSACEEQGLLRLEKVFCCQGKCGQCPISRSE